MANTTLHLKFDEIPSLFNNSVKLLALKNRLYGFEGATLYYLRYWNRKWEMRHKISLDYDSNQLLHVFPVTKSSDVLIATKLPDLNLFFFECEKFIYKKTSYKLINDEGSREEVKLFFGNFYNDIARMGILIIYPDSKFNSLEMVEGKGHFVLQSVNIGIEILERICKDYKTFRISHVKKDPKQMLICQKTGELNVFEFDAQDVVKSVLKIPIGNDKEPNKEDDVYFANISGQEDWMDMIALNSSGLFLFRYQEKSSSLFHLIDYNPSFSASNGWTDKHTKSIHFEDVDENGFDDLIFTGPGGLEILSYDYNTNKWRSLLSTEDLTAKGRHSTVMLVLPKAENGIPNAVIFSRHSRDIHLSNIIQREAEIVHLPPINKNFRLSPNELPVVLQPKKERNKVPLSTIYLRDQNIQFDHSNSVNPRTGKPSFVLPLLGESESAIRFHLYYDGSNDANMQLGVGWSMPQNFIALNYKDGNFEEDESYVLVLESIPHRLKWLPSNSTETTLIFDLETARDDQENFRNDRFKAEFDCITSTWEVHIGNDRIQLYGKFDSDNMGAVLTDSSWQHWRGLGIDRTGSIERVNMWYLAADKRKQFTCHYEYDVIRKTTEPEGAGFAYNEGVFLKKIQNGLSEIQFSYSNNSNSSIHITGYTYKTKTKEQTVLLKYSSVGKSLLLMSIEQKSDYTAQPVIQFKYSKHSKGKQFLAGIKLPSGTKILYKYISLAKRTAMITERKISVSDDYNVSYGDGFTLVSYVDKIVNRIVLRVFNNDFSEEIFPFGMTSNGPWPKLGRQYTVEAHEILMGDDFLTVVIYSSPWKSICSFGRLHSGQWLTPAVCYEYSELSTILKGNNFILVSEPSSDVKLIEWLREDNKWVRPLSVPTSSGVHRSIAVDGNKFVIYDDVSITMGYRDANQIWSFKKLTRVPGYMEATSEVLQKFRLNHDFQKALEGFFRNNAITFRHNLVALSGLRINKNEYFTTDIRTYVIGRDHRVAIENHTVVVQDKISEIVSEEETNSEGDKFTLSYVLVNNTFRIKLRNFLSPTRKLETRFAEKIDSEMNVPTAQRFLLNLKNYYVSLRGQTVMCRNVKYVFGGNYWHRSENKLEKRFQDAVSILLSDTFLVNKTDSESTLKLYNSSNNKIVTDFEVKEANELQIKYPIYIAWQKKGGAVGVMEFKNGESGLFSKFTLPRYMELSPFGNLMNMVTSQTDPAGNKTVSIWPIYGIRRFLPDSVISSVKVIISGQSAGPTQRVIGYEYDENSVQLVGSKVHYHNVSVLPGNNKAKFGYFEIIDKTVDVFNGEGKFIKRIHSQSRSTTQSQEHFNQTLQLKEDATLYDQSGCLEIANYAPYPITSNMSGFFGFEDYERPTENWIYEKKNVIREGFALTGKNYLRLDYRAVKGIFTPKYQDRQFVASCWIRIATEDTPKLGNVVPLLRAIEDTPKLGDVVPLLRAIVIKDEGYEVFNALGDVKLQIDSWSYLEVAVDLEFIHSVLTLANQSQSSNLGIEICISSSKHFPIHVDNVRFSSLENVFDANVYDEESSKLVATIRSSGAITRLIYDKYEVQIAEINESNQISEFITYTKGSYLIEKFGNPACLVKIIPQIGFYDDFFPNAVSKNWMIPNSYSLGTSPSGWQHHTVHPREMILTTEDIDHSSFGIRFLYSLQYHSFLVIFGAVKVQRSGDDRAFVLVGDDESNKQEVPNEGEILLIREGPRIVLWIDGGLYVDQYCTFSTSLKIQFEGQVLFQQMMLFSRPKVQVIYKNSLNEEIQEILLSSEGTAIVKELLYDELGRQRLTVQPTEISRFPHESIISYVADFVTNDVPNGNDSVWKNGQLVGEASILQGHKFGYSEVVYDNHPLNGKISVGIPGEHFSARGKFASRFKLTSSNTFLQNQYPPSKNFTHRTLLKPSGEERVYILNGENLKVASYIHIKNGKDIFSTFEYNAMGLMTNCLTPLYYENFGVFDKSTLDLTGVVDGSSREVERFGICVDYDIRGNPTKKTTPDTGPLEFLYDNNDRMRFMIQYFREFPNVKESVVYFTYDVLGRVAATGSLINFPDKNQLMELNISDEDVHEFQHFYHSDSEKDPVLRQNILRTITINRYSALHEESIMNLKGEVISKRHFIPNGSDQPKILSIDKRYQGGFLKEIIYPASMFGESFRVSYSYDTLGRMVAIGIPGQVNRFVTMTYNANDQVLTEMVTPLRRKKFVRRYKYNEPGFLIQIDDPFLCEEISYIENGYDDNAKGDGTVSRVKFTAKWHDSASSDGIGVHQNSFENEVISQSDSQKCFRELKEQGYLDHRNRQSRVFYPELGVKLSAACTNGTMETRVKEVLGKYGFPERFGFRFDYTGHVELRKAKYFVGSEEPTVFHMGTFAENIPSISVSRSQKIWKKLQIGGYIVKDDYGREVPAPFIRETLTQDLKSIDPGLVNHTRLLKKLIIMQFSNKSLDISRSHILEQWHPKSTQAELALQSLLREDYLQNPLQQRLTNILEEFEDIVPEIVGVMHKYSAIGRAEFDVESVDIDLNGNRLQFYEGFEEYSLKYEDNCNRVSSVTFSKYHEKSSRSDFEMRHDSRGNVIQANHKGIQFIQYHPVSNRVEEVVMQNGNCIKFDYNSKGERVRKFVINSEGQKTIEMEYLRDEHSRTLVERQSTYIAENQAPITVVTMYIYGPKSLVGFVRHDQFYSVITDHQNSVRLIVRDGEAVAAYDYFPYGNLMRIYGRNPNAHIPYRYTGQEWDPELGLYNFQSRFYDPSIGRFYQVDPMMQYFSPYKFAGNSPVSMVDTTGGFAVMALAIATLAFALLGSYLAGASVNDNLNPFKWDWSSRDTQLAIFFGGIGGAFMPVSFSASIAALGGISITSVSLVISAGLAASYMSVAASQNDRNPGNWDYVSPKTWNAAFEGFSVGVGILGGWNEAGKQFVSLSRRSKYAFGTSVAIFGTSSFVLGRTEENWDFRKPQIWYSFLTSTASAPDLAFYGNLAMKFARKHANEMLHNLHDIEHYLIEMIYRSRQNSLTYLIQDSLNGKALVGNLRKGSRKFTLGSAASSFLWTSTAFLLNGDFESWSFSDFKTYYNLLVSVQLTGKLFEITTAIRMKPRYQIWSKPLADIVMLTNDAFARAIVDTRSRSWRYIWVRKIPLHPRMHRTISSSTPSVEVSNLTLSIKFSNISLVYTRNRFINPFFMVSETNGDDWYEDDSTLSQEITNSISAVRGLLESHNLRIFRRENITNWLTEESILRTLLDAASIRKCAEAITKAFESHNALIGRDLMASTFDNLSLDFPQVSVLKQKYIEKEKELVQLEKMLEQNSLEFRIRNSFLLRRHFLKVALNNLKKEEGSVLTNAINKVSEKLWNKLKSFRDLLSSWEFANSAEPSEIMLSFSETTPTTKYTPNTNAFDSKQNFRHLSDNKLKDKPRLMTFENCHNCIKATPKVWDTVKDITWLTLLNADFHQVNRGPTPTQGRRKRFISSRDGDLKKTESKGVKGSYNWFPNVGLNMWRLWSRHSGKIPTSPCLENFWTRSSNKTANLPFNFTEFGDQIFSQMSCNESLLLAEVLVARCTRSKLYNSSKPLLTPTFMREQAFACQVMDLYDRLLIAASKVADIGANRLDTSCRFDLHKKVVQIAIAKDFEHIPNLIIEFSLKTLPNTKRGRVERLSLRKRRLFEKFYSRSIVRKNVNQIVTEFQMLAGE